MFTPSKRWQFHARFRAPTLENLVYRTSGAELVPIRFEAALSSRVVLKGAVRLSERNGAEGRRPFTSYARGLDTLLRAVFVISCL